MKEITVVAENTVGALASVAEAVGGAGVNIEAISAYANDGNAIFRFVTTDPTSAMKILSKLTIVKSVSGNDIIIKRLINRPGELGKITRKLANYRVDLESIYIVSKADDYTEIAIRPAEEYMGKAKEVLGIK